MLKRRMLALMLSVVCCGGAILAGCSQNQGAGTSDAITSAGGKTGNDVQEGTGADSGGDTAGKNKLAYFFPLTGDNMQYGEMLMRGSELAVELFNKENGTDYITEFNDDKGDATEAVNVANKIVSDSSVIAGLGSYASSCAMAAAPIFESNKLLLVSPAASHTDFPGMGEFMFSCVMSQKYEGSEFAKELYKITGGKKLAIIYQNTDQGVLATDLFANEWENLGGEVVAKEAFITGSTKDFTPILSNVKNKGAEIIYASAAYNEASQIFIQAKSLDISAQLVGPGMCLKKELLDIVGDKADGALILSSIPYFSDNVEDTEGLDDKTRTFITAFKEKYGEVPDGFAAQAFDTTNILLDCIKKVGTDSEALRQEIASILEFNGVSGYNMAFNESKEMIKGIYVYELKDGDFVRVDQ